MKKHRSSQTARSNNQRRPPNWIYFVAGVIAAGGLLTWLLTSIDQPVINTASPTISEKIKYVPAETLFNQFSDCIEVSKPKNTSLEDELPLGEYDDFESRFKLEIRTEIQLSDNGDGLISSCTGIDRLYELKPLMEQHCNCKIDIICPC